MVTYCVNKITQPTGEHEIHTYDCSYLPDENNRMYLGDFKIYQDAIKEAEKFYYNVDRCYYCSRECDTR